MGYSRATTLTIVIHLYVNYARIFATDLADNDKNLREPCNSDEPLKSLYTRLNECDDYATAVGEPIIEGQVIHIAYSLVTETGQFQEYCRTWCSKSELENTCTQFQAHFIKAQADLRERQ